MGIAHKITSVAARALEGALDAVFPRTCPGCGRRADRPGRHICGACMGQLMAESLDGPVCEACGAPVKAVTADGLCHECRCRRPRFDAARSALAYMSLPRSLVHDFKYHGGLWLAEDLTDILEACVRARLDVRAIDAVLPVPLHPAKFVLRNYNQSAILAKRLARRLDIPYLGRSVSRRRDTPTQTHLAPKGRRKNVRGAFAVDCPEAIRSRTLLVVDDVMTTGATLGEIADTLKKSGAWRVFAATLCRA